MQPMQMGFDMVYTDPNTQEVVPWAVPDEAMLQRISAAPWKIVDVETSGLNPTSKEQSFTGKELRRGINPVLRLRVLSVLIPAPIGSAYPLEVIGFDFDQLTQQEREAVASASFSEVVIAHNAGFDAYWIRVFTRVQPHMLLDTMLLARILCPEQPLVMARMCNDEMEDPDLRTEAENMFIRGKSGWSLADLAVGQLRRILSKDLQGPKNWCQPFLTQASYGYATGDVITTYDLVVKMFDMQKGDDLLARYNELRAENRVIRMIEPQVMDIVVMREHGMPWSAEDAEAYVAAQGVKVAEFAAKMAELEPELIPMKAAMADAGKGVTAVLKTAIGEAFTRRGIELEMTEKSGAFKIGEKDLRRVKAQINDDAKVLFDTWVGLNRAKKAGGMAREVTGFSIRSGDCRLHPNTGHGPVTGRLASSEPNCQQFPRDQGFRNCVKANPGHKIVASDYSALDMRVGAALAIRAQKQIFEAYMGDRPCNAEVLRCISRVFEGTISLEVAVAEEQRAIKAFEDWKEKRETVADQQDARRKYWDEYRKRSRVQLLAGFQRCLKDVRVRADQEDTSEWGSLRDAFSIPGMDIHTWTALGMIGHDPKAMFSGLSPEAVAVALKQSKKELGDQRQTGKVGNLSLLYAMKTLGLMDAAAKNYNIHWTYEEANKVRMDWLAAYVEIDLWHKWTELNPVEEVYVPDPDRGNRFSKKQVYASNTLGDRLIFAFGLNAALSYEDQSTGADILGTVMEALRLDHPAIYATTVNQVHDELVFEIPDARVEGDTITIQKVMVAAAEKFTMPFGIPVECSPAVGNVWLKD